MSQEIPQGPLDNTQAKGLVEISHKGIGWLYSADELAIWDGEEGYFEFYAFHGLTQPTTETVIAFIETQTIDTVTNDFELVMDQAKDEILSCMDNASHVIHDSPTEPDFLQWWTEHGSGDLSLSQIQLLDVYRQLRAEIYTFNSCLAEYRRLLLERPQHALRIGAGQFAYLQANGELIGLSVDRDSSIDQAHVYDFDSSAFNTSTGGWMEESYVDTRKHIAEPEFIPVTASFTTSD